MTMDPRIRARAIRGLLGIGYVLMAGAAHVVVSVVVWSDRLRRRGRLRGSSMAGTTSKERFPRGRGTTR